MSIALQDLIDRVESTRARIESQIGANAVVNIASAHFDDGGRELASLLAHSFTRSGYTTLLVEPRSSADVNYGVSAVKEIDVLSKIRPARQGVPDILRLDDVGVRSVNEVKDLYASLKSKYQVAITSQSFKQNPGLLGLASMADVTLVSIKAGRGAKSADRELNDLLRASQAPVLGVVLVDPAAVKAMAVLQRSEVSLIHAEQEAATARRGALSARVG
ncbi:MAG: hypothetical protein IAI50_08110 [Candidatus Eremiobacteraeota bacterium]|nr:hypothetical protein [Candidatus Eremiobacteraeota bacterium]